MFCMLDCTPDFLLLNGESSCLNVSVQLYSHNLPYVWLVYRPGDTQITGVLISSNLLQKAKWVGIHRLFCGDDSRMNWI